MRKRVLSFLMILLCASMFLTSVAGAHSGRTDSNGGHWDRKNGTYHYHNGGSRSKSSRSVRKAPATPTSKITITNIPKKMILADQLDLVFSTQNTANVTWITSNSQVVAVTSQGRLEAVGVGKAKITAKMDHGSRSFQIQVQGIKAEQLEVANRPERLSPGETWQLAAMITPQNAHDKAIRWTSSNKRIVSVDSNGLLTATGAGKATVTGVARSNSQAKIRMQVLVGVFSESIDIVAPEAAKGGSKITLIAEIQPKDTTNQKLRWEVEPKGVGTVSGKGVLSLKAVKEPVEITVRAIAMDTGISAEKTISVSP